MDDYKKPPLEFADQVIDLYADNLTDQESLRSEDYSVIRLAFRKAKGSWFELCQGNPKHVGLMADVVKTWGEQQAQ